MKNLFKLLAAGDLVYNPYTELDRHIAAAGNRVTKHFERVRASLAAGKKPKAAIEHAGRIDPVLRQVITSSRIAGFTAAAKIAGRQVPPSYGLSVSLQSIKRSGAVAKAMARVTKKQAKLNPDGFGLSEERALRAVKFEAGRAYYKGVADGFRGTGWGKTWVTTSANCCDDCDDNEDQGVVDVDEAFQSGHDYPPMHPNCQCFTTIRKGK